MTATRMLTAHGLITLPKLTADETVALIQRFIAQASETRVPASATEPFDAMKQSGADLDQATRSKANAPKGADIRDAHIGVQRAWNVCEQWLGAFAALPDDADPRVPAAKKLYGMLFGEGLGFVNTRIEVEWAQSDRKIHAVADARLVKEFDALGGRVFWTNVTSAHEREGRVAHLTTATPDAGPEPNQLERMLAAQDAIREYVAHVIGTVRRSKPATQVVADALLRPLATWTDAASTPAKPADAPAPPAAPTA